MGLSENPSNRYDPVEWAFSGSVCSLPMQHPPVGRDFHATSAEVITEYGGLMQL